MSEITTLDRYQVEALRTAALSPDLTLRRAVLGLGIAGEAGEVADLIKKEVGHGHETDHDKIAKEIGDVLWYVATLADAYGFSLSEVANININKLKARYPDGFSSASSINREV